MLREFMKWDYELRHPEQVETILDRALAIAKKRAQDRYTSLCRARFSLPRFRVNSVRTRRSLRLASRADPDTLDEAAKCSAGLKAIADHGERRPHRRSGACHPATRRDLCHSGHPTTVRAILRCRPSIRSAAGVGSAGLLPQSDLGPGGRMRRAWLPSQGNPKADAKVVHIGADPLFARYPLRGSGPTSRSLRRRADRLMPCASARRNTLPLLK